jgi:hypothetical protein
VPEVGDPECNDDAACAADDDGADDYNADLSAGADDAYDAAEVVSRRVNRLMFGHRYKWVWVRAPMGPNRLVPRGSHAARA